MPEDKDTSKVDFLNEITDTPDIFSEKESESEEEAGDEAVVEEEEEKPLPFHKDPKVQRYVEKQIEKALKDIKPVEAQFRAEVEDINLPQSFIRLIGNDTDEKVQVLKDLSSYFGTLKGEARKEFLEELQEQEQRVAVEDEKAVEELHSGFEQIEETHNVDLTSNSTTARKTQAAFKEYIRKISPKDENGEVIAFADIPAAWESFTAQAKTHTPSRAKELASRGLTRSTDADTATPAGRSWKDVERYFSKLKADT